MPFNVIAFVTLGVMQLLLQFLALIQRLVVRVFPVFSFGGAFLFLLVSSLEFSLGIMPFLYILLRFLSNLLLLFEGQGLELDLIPRILMPISTFIQGVLHFLINRAG